ncbi:hypothetical protein OY671_011275, partial [Metschnikowia pulcherrima]
EPSAAALSGKAPVAIAQDDTFFACPDGRLKSRVFADGKGESIFYRRADAAGPKESFYVISPTASPDTSRDASGSAYGVIGRVRKQRSSFMAGRTRIHVDRVGGSGEFSESEVVSRDGESVEDGMAEAHESSASSQIAPEQLLSGAYSDSSARRP